MAVRGRGSRGCSVGWLIVGLLGLAFFSGLVVFIRKRRARPSADDTLVADLLGPPELPEFPAPRTWDDGPHPSAPRAQKHGQPARAPRARKDRWPPRAAGRAAPNPLAREDGHPPPTADRPSTASQQPAPAAGRPSPENGQPSPAASRQTSPAPGRVSPAAQAQQDDGPSPAPSARPAGGEDWLETQLAWINAWSQQMKEQITSAVQPERHSKE